MYAERLLLNDESDPMITGIKPVYKKPRLDTKSAVARLQNHGMSIGYSNQL